MTTDTLWRAVVSRDRRADGLFVYGVTSTRVYCRPSCASRRPHRERVRFFPTPALAESSGYRSCRRCRPADPGGRPDAASIRLACEAISRSPDTRWSPAALARAGGVSASQLQRAFRALLGLSPLEYARACRHREFLVRLRAGGRVTDAVYEAGYGSASRVYEGGSLSGMTPATYGRGGVGARILWATTASAIGRILVASTARGLCFVAVGRDEADLHRELVQEFPKAEIGGRASPGLGRFLDAACAIAAAQPAPADLPLDIRGTAFQWRVWRALTAIPVGATRRYAELAAAIGRPRAARAVGRACATNPLSLVVPCHRVVGTTGDLTGYRWGRDVKRALLEREAARIARR